jgi:aurora kinase
VNQLLVLDPEKRIPLEEVETHPWIVKYCQKGERAFDRASGGKMFRSSSEPAEN